MKIQLELKRDFLKWMPYIYLIALVTFWMIGDLIAIQSVSYVALGALAVLIFQAITQNKAVGTCLGVVVTVGSLYAFLAVLSEFNDFEVVTNSAIQLISVGSVLTLSGLAMGVILSVNNLKKLAV